MALTLGELAGIISLDEKPAMAALGRVRQGMRDTASEGQKSTDKMQAQQAKFAAAVENASSAVTRARAREKDAADGVRLAEIRLADAKRKGAEGSAQVVSAEKAVRSAYERVRASHDATAKSTRDLEMAQSRLANTSETTSKRVGTSFGNMGQSGNRAGRTAAKGFAILTLGLTGVVPAAGAGSAALIAMAGSALTLGGSIKQLLGVAALAPAALFAVGSGAGVLLSAFNGMGEALKTATEQTSESAGAARLDAMTLADAARGVAQAERAASDQRADAAKRVSDAQKNAAQAQEDAAERVASAEKQAADDRAAAARRLADAQSNLTRVVDQNSEQQASALGRVADAERDVERAQRSVLDAQEDLTQARFDAVRQIDDLNDALKNSGLSERDAALRYEDALAAFNSGVESGSDATSRQMRGLQLDLDQAAFGLEEAREEAERLRVEQAQGAAEGIKGSKRVVDAEQALADAREAATDAVKGRAAAVAEVAKVERENADRVVEAQAEIADATREAADVQVESAANIAKAVEDGAEAQADAADAVAEAVADAARVQVDSAESVADAHRNLERVQLQQAEAAIAATEKSVDAMNKLTPSAKVFAAALLVAYGRLGDVQDLAQENFFEGMDEPILALVDTVIPQLERGVGRLARAYGDGAQTWLRALDRELGNGVLESMFDDSTEAAYILNDAIDPIVAALITLTDVGMEYMPRLAGGIRDAAIEFDAFIQEAAEDGSLRGWIDNGIEGTKDLFSILGSTLGILDKLEDAARTGGIATTLGSVADGLDRIEETAGGEVFQSTLSTIFAGAKGGADGLLAALGPIGEAFRVGGPALAEFLRLGGEIAGTFVGSMFTGLSDPNFGAGLTTFLEGVQDGVEVLGPKLPGLFEALGGILEAVAPIVEAFGPTAVGVLTDFAEGFGAILGFAEPLLTELAGSPVAVGIFLGVIGAATTLNVISTFATSLQSVATGFRAIWIAATGPVGLAIIGVTALIVAASAAADWFFTETELGQQVAEDFAIGVSDAFGRASTTVQYVLAPAMVQAMVDIQDQASDTQVSVAADLYTLETKAGSLATWWGLRFGEMAASTEKSSVEMSADLLGLRNDASYHMSGIGVAVGMLPGYFSAAKTVANTHMAGLATGALGLKNDISRYMTGIETVLGLVPGYFEAAKTGAMLAWNLMKEEAKIPIRFVVDTVLGGLVQTMWDYIPGVNEKNLPKPKLPKGFRDGGYTGNVGVNEAAGVVHGKEFVFTAAQTAAIGKDNLAAQAHAAVRGGAATAGQGNMSGFFEGNAAAIRRHGAYYLDVAAGLGDWNFPAAARMWDGAAGVKVQVGRGNLQGRATPLERGGGILGYTTGNNIDMSPSWMRQLGATQRRTVAAHEMGHAMGLPHNSMNSIMQPNLGQMASTPTALDIRNMQHLFPGGSGQAGEGGGDVEAVNPLTGVLGGLIGLLKKQFPEGGMFVDAAGGLATAGYEKAFSYIEDIRKGIGDIAGDVVGNIRDFFGGAMTPTVFDGGGWLHDTGGPQLVQHNKSKPDAVIPYDEFQVMRKAALSGGVRVEQTLQYVGPDMEALADRQQRRLQEALEAYA